MAYTLGHKLKEQTLFFSMIGEARTKEAHWNTFLSLSADRAARLLFGSNTSAYLKSAEFKKKKTPNFEC